MEAAAPDDHIRLAELMAALSLATDLGLGRPLEDELGVCLSALELAERLGCTPEESSDVYYVALLVHVGCTAAAPDFASWVGGDEIHFLSGVEVLGPASEPVESVRYLVRRLADDRPLPERARLVGKQLVGGQKLFELAAAHMCEGGRLLARGLHLPDEVARALGQVTTRWDGKGIPGDAGEEISRPLRIVRVAHDFVAVAHGRDRDTASRRSASVAGAATTRRSSMRRSPSPSRSCARRRIPMPSRASSTPSRSRWRRSRGRGSRWSPGPSASSSISSSVF